MSYGKRTVEVNVHSRTTNHLSLWRRLFNSRNLDEANGALENTDALRIPHLSPFHETGSVNDKCALVGRRHMSDWAGSHLAANIALNIGRFLHTCDGGQDVVVVTYDSGFDRRGTRNYIQTSTHESHGCGHGLGAGRVPLFSQFQFLWYAYIVE